MGIEERRARQREHLRQEILEAAGQLFATEGFANVSMRRIAERIEYSPTTIYLHFEDKADLLQQLCEHTFTRLIERIEAVALNSEHPLDGLLKGCRAYIRFGLEHPHHYLVTFVQSPEDKCEIEFEGSMGQQAFALLERSITKCVDSGVFPSVDIRKTSSYWWAAIHGLTSLLIAHKGFPWADTDDLIEEMLGTLVRGLEAAPAAEPATQLAKDQVSA